jgi:hypothetical protein
MEDDKWEMYDLSKDPEEQDNIIDSSDRTEEMKDKLKSKINWYDKGDTPVIKVTKF